MREGVKHPRPTSLAGSWKEGEFEREAEGDGRRAAAAVRRALAGDCGDGVGDRGALAGAAGKTKECRGGSRGERRMQSKGGKGEGRWKIMKVKREKGGE